MTRPKPLFIFIFLIILGCQRETLIINTPQNLNEFQIKNYYEFSNDVKWFLDNRGFAIYTSPQDTLVFNKYYNRFACGEYQSICINNIYELPNKIYLAFDGEKYFHLDTAAYKNPEFKFKSVEELKETEFLHIDNNTKHAIFLKEINNDIYFLDYDGENIKQTKTDIPVEALEIDYASDKERGIWTIRKDFSINDYYFIEHYNFLGKIDEQIHRYIHYYGDYHNIVYNMTTDYNGKLWGIYKEKVWIIQGDSMLFLSDIQTSIPSNDWDDTRRIVGADDDNTIWFVMGHEYYIYDIDNNTHITLNKSYDDIVLMGRLYNYVYIIKDGCVYKLNNSNLEYCYGKNNS